MIIKTVFEKIFVDGEYISSRRILAFFFAIVMVVLMFCNFNIEYVKICAYLVGILLGLTTISSGIDKVEETKVEINDPSKTS